MSDDRLYKVYNSAKELFIDNGYSQTQVSDIAKNAKVSVGSMYSLFENKKTIFYFLLKSCIQEDFIDNVSIIPLKDDDFIAIEKDLLAVFEDSQKSLGQFLQKDSFEFIDILNNAYNTVYKYGVGMLLIQKNCKEFSSIAKVYDKYRLDFFKTIYQIVQILIDKKKVRQVEDLEIAVRVIVETIVFFAMKLNNSSYEKTSIITDERAKKGCIDALLHAYSI